MNEGKLSTAEARSRAAGYLRRTDASALRWIWYDGDRHEGYVLWDDLLIWLDDTAGTLTVVQAYVLSAGIKPWLRRGRDELVVIVSRRGDSLLLGVWDIARRHTARSLFFFCPLQGEVIPLENTAGASWFDLSFDGDQVALIHKHALRVLNLDEMEGWEADSLRANTLSFLPDGKLLVRATDQQVTIVDPATEAIQKKRSGRYAVPLTQPLNSRIEVQMRIDQTQRAITLVKKPQRMHMPQERYIPMQKEDKRKFNEWLSAQGT